MAAVAIVCCVYLHFIPCFAEALAEAPRLAKSFEPGGGSGAFQSHVLQDYIERVLFYQEMPP